MLIVIKSIFFSILIDEYWYQFGKIFDTIIVIYKKESLIKINLDNILIKNEFSLKFSEN